jgi:mannosyltransferase
MSAQRPRDLSVSHDRERERIEWIILAAGVIGLAIVVRLLNLTSQGLWYDELQSVTFAHLPLKELLRNVNVFDYHPPLYYLQLHFWMLPNASDAWVRMNSVFWGTLTTASLLIAGRQIFERRTALLAASIFAISPIAVHYGQEARMYAMMMFLAVWIWFFTYEFFAGWHPWISAAGILASTTAFLYSQGAGFLIFPATFIYALLVWIAERGKWRPLAKWGLIQAAILGLYIPWLLRAATLADIHAALPGIGQVNETLSELFFGYINSQPTWLVILTWIILGLLVIALIPEKETRNLFIPYMAAPLIACLTISYLFQSIWLTRSLSFLAPFLSLSLALALEKLQVYVRKHSLPEKVIKYGLVALVICGSLAFLLYQQRTYKEVWAPRDAVQLVDVNTRPADVVAIATKRLFWGWCWYAVKPGSINPASEDYSLISQEGNRTILAEGKMENLLKKSKTIWFIYRNTDELSMIPALPGIKREVVYDDLNLVVEKVTWEEPQTGSP